VGVLVFFYLSKVLFLLVQPSVLCLLLIAGGLFFKRQRIAVTGLLALVVIGFSPLANVFTLPLESRFPRPQLVQLADKISGIIILGGFEDAYTTDGRNLLSLNEAAERLTEGLLLAHKLPKARVIFTGGSASILNPVQSAAGAVSEFLTGAGIAADRIVLERQSRNTRENATMTFDMVQPKAGEKWLLVTSAFHMARSMGVFRVAGFDVIAWPVDYRTVGPQDAGRMMNSLDDGVKRIDMITKEYIGLVMYRLRGWTDVLWPAPL
jgi:uncharacterized SAM-binding protein YcdF (DUF218 family)